MRIPILSDLRLILSDLSILKLQARKQMALLDDLNTAVGNLQASVKAAVTDITNAAADISAAVAANNPAAIQAAIDAINASASNLTAAVAANPFAAPVAAAAAAAPAAAPPAP